MNRTWKQLATTIANTSAARPAFRLLARRHGARSNILRVLTYHRIGSPEQCPEMDRDVFSARPEAFRSQMECLVENYQPVSIDDVVCATYEGKSLPARAVLVTFDDAYRDFQEHAWPVLRELNIPVTLFVPTGYPGSPEREFWWDRLSRATVQSSCRERFNGPWGPVQFSSEEDRQASLRRIKTYLKALPHTEAMQWIDHLCAEGPAASPANGSVLSWSELRRLSDEGVDLGLHTRNHPLLNRVPPESVGQEIAGAWVDLQAQIGRPVRAFAYPGGAVSDAARKQLEVSRFLLAFSTEPGLNSIRRDDPLLLRRFHVGLNTTTSLLWARLAVGR